MVVVVCFLYLQQTQLLLQLFPLRTKFSIQSSIRMFHLICSDISSKYILLSWEMCKKNQRLCFLLTFRPSKSTPLNVVENSGGQWCLYTWQVWKNFGSQVCTWPPMSQSFCHTRQTDRCAADWAIPTDYRGPHVTNVDQSSKQQKRFSHLPCTKLQQFACKPSISSIGYCCCTIIRQQLHSITWGS